VILITLDTQRADYISAYNPGNARTPHIDALARQGIRFENGYSLIPITLPSHASLFTSRPPHALENYNNGQPFRKKHVNLLAVIFKDHGFATAAFISLGVLKSKFGLNEGFDIYEDRFPEERWYLNASEVNERIFPWLEEHRNRKFFLWIHYSDPHDPYAPPSLPSDLKVYHNGRLHSALTLQKNERLILKFSLKPGENAVTFRVLNGFPDGRDDFRASLNDFVFRGPEGLNLEYDQIHVLERPTGTSLLVKKEGTLHIFNPGAEKECLIETKGNLNLLPSEKREGYRREVEYMDAQIGELIRRLKAWNLFSKTCILLVGDHGEGLGEHEAHFGHIHFLYDVYMKIPLIIRTPVRDGRGRTIRDPATLLDVAPTILSLMGWKKPPSYQGRNLLDSGAPGGRFIFEETYTPESFYDRFAGLNHPWHLIYTPKKQVFELYHLERDPEEKKNLYFTEKLSPPASELQKKVRSKAREILSRKKEVKVDKKSRDMLKALGYIK